MPEDRPLRHVNRPLTEEERQQAVNIRAGAQRDFPPQTIPETRTPPGIPSRIRQAREQRGLTRYELAKFANVPSTVVRGLEEGEDVPLSQLNALVSALGLTIELVEQT